MPALVRRQALSATLGAVAGVGLGVGALALVRAEQTSERDDAGTRAALASFMANGPESGKWVIETRVSSQTKRFQQDPSAPGTMLVTDLDDALLPVRPVYTDWITRCLAGDVGLFLQGYSPAGPPLFETVGDRREVGMRYKRSGCAACASRVIYRDMIGQFVTRMEDRAFDGELVQRIRLVERDPQTADSAVRAPRPPADRSQTTFADWVASLPIPVYEPARLPERFQRIAFWTPKDLTGAVVRLRPVLISYSDGVARMELLIATKKDMDELDKYAREFQKAGPSTCPATSDALPEESVDGPSILRRTDRCRTVLRRVDLPEVSVVLVGFNEIPPHLYVETIQSLVKVSK